MTRQTTRTARYTKEIYVKITLSALPSAYKVPLIKDRVEHVALWLLTPLSSEPPSPFPLSLLPSLSPHTFSLAVTEYAGDVCFHPRSWMQPLRAKSDRSISHSHFTPTVTPSALLMHEVSLVGEDPIRPCTFLVFAIFIHARLRFPVLISWDFFFGT